MVSCVVLSKGKEHYYFRIVGNPSLYVGLGQLKAFTRAYVPFKI